MNNWTNIEKQAKFFNRQDWPKFDNISDAAQFITDFMGEQYHVEPYCINCGYCFIWAYLVSTVFPDVSFVTTTGHVVIKYKGMYYDSEHIHGVSNLYSIDGMGHNQKEVDLPNMCWFWARNGSQKRLFRKILAASCSKAFYKMIWDKGSSQWNGYVHFSTIYAKVPKIKCAN